jgi:hypothetical protein
MTEPVQHAEYVAPWDGLNPPYRCTEGPSSPDAATRLSCDIPECDHRRSNRGYRPTDG